MPDPSASDDDGRDPLADLADAAHDVTSPFVCEGELEAEGTPSIRLASGVRVALDPREWGLASKLERHCRPVTAGEGTPHRWRLDAAGGAFRVEGFDPATNGVLDAARAALFPDDPSPLRAELHALDVDEPGAASLAPREVPRGEAVGSLVAWAPSGYTGGEWVVGLRGLERRFQWMFHRGATRAAVPWVASFGEVDHAAEPVESGALVTLTWSLHRAEGAPARMPAGETHGERFTAALVAALGDRGFFPDGATLGFSCATAYGDAVGLSRGAEGLTERSVRKLGGRDRVIAEAALDLGLEVRLLPYLVDDETGEHRRLARFLDAGERARFYPPDEAPDEAPDEVDWVIAPRGSGIEQVTTKAPPAERLGGDHSALYQRAAVTVRVPPYEARRAQAAAYVKRPRAAAMEAAPVAAPKVAAKAPVVKAPVVKAAPAVKAPTAAKSMPKEEVTAGQLRALGYGPAEVKRLVADGTLEKTGFGWYRFVRAPA